MRFFLEFGGIDACQFLCCACSRTEGTTYEFDDAYCIFTGLVPKFGLMPTNYTLEIEEIECNTICDQDMT